MSRTPMKLILTQEVTGLGAPGDVVEVAGGYGRNYLVPRGLAMRWTRGAEKQVDLIKRARSARDIRGLDDAKETVARLGALNVRFLGHRGGGARRRRARTRPAPDRVAQPDQDHRGPPGPGAAAPRGDRHYRNRDRREVSLRPGSPQPGRARWPGQLASGQ